MHKEIDRERDRERKRYIKRYIGREIEREDIETVRKIEMERGRSREIER